MRRVFRLALAASMLLAAPAVSAQSIRFDPHIDLPASAAEPGWTGATDPSSQFDIDRALKGGLNVVGLTVFTPQTEPVPAATAEARWALAARHHAIEALLRNHPDRTERARSPSDARRIAAAGKLAVVETLLNPWPIGDDLSAFDRWHATGVAIVGLAHAGHNQFTDSSRPALARGEPPSVHGGLSPLGRSAITRLNDLGVLIDVSQLSDAAFDQVLALSRAPVVASHSSVRAKADVARNLSDAQLGALKAKGGVVAINAFSAYLRPDGPETGRALAALQAEFGIAPGGITTALSVAQQAEYTRRYYAIRATEPRATVSDLVNSIDYAVRRIGIDHVAISSDFNHGGGVEGWSHVGESEAITAELRRRGYRPDQIEQLWGGNLLRVWQAAIDARTRR